MSDFVEVKTIKSEVLGSISSYSRAETKKVKVEVLGKLGFHTEIKKIKLEVMGDNS